ncbi:uncharacterized protein LOC125042182 [Penaeus chinensis]|uniref:uncharacterized protein LOC125042182 n=1 Tax=Penaeus chinensis TaxID=139456 RepID=UPI001FB58CC5|nr:uncharacterized protein LOC125042182 [Penaeus chinensis]
MPALPSVTPAPPGRPTAPFRAAPRPQESSGRSWVWLLAPFLFALTLATPPCCAQVYTVLLHVDEDDSRGETATRGAATGSSRPRRTRPALPRRTFVSPLSPCYALVFL